MTRGGFIPARTQRVFAKSEAPIFPLILFAIVHILLVSFLPILAVAGLAAFNSRVAMFHISYACRAGLEMGRRKLAVSKPGPGELTVDSAYVGLARIANPKNATSLPNNSVTIIGLENIVWVTGTS